MAKAFDPYRDWLGLEGPPGTINHYRLLRLALFESDPAKIAAAAEATIGRIRQIKTQSHLAEQEQLLVELAEARRVLLDDAGRARYNATLGTTEGDGPIAFAVPIADDPPPINTPQSFKRPAASPAAPSPRTNDEPSAPAAPEISEALWKDSDSIPRRLRTAPRADPTARWVALASFVFVAALLAAGGMWLVRLDDKSQPGLPVATGPTGQQPPATSGLPVPNVAPQDPAKRPAQTPRPAARTKPDDDPPAELPLTAARNRDAPRAAPTHPPAQTAKKELPANSTPDAAVFNRAMNRARVALASRDLPAAARELERAERHAPDDTGRIEAARLRALSAELAHFMDAVRAGLAKLQATDEIRVGDWIAVVVEKGPDSLTLFDEGMRRDYTLVNMPSKVALFVAAMGADENSPEMKRAAGAFQLVDADGDAATARRLWNSAAAGGQSLDELLPLAEPGAIAIRRDPLPSREALEAATPRATARFAALLDAARAPAQQSDLAGRLLTASRDSESSLDQYALLTRAGELAAQASDARAALQVADELARWFDVDALVQKSKILSTLAAGTPGTTRAKVIARRSIELADTALAQDRAELAQSFAETALAAARKSRDPELIKQMAERRKEIGKEK